MTQLCWANLSATEEQMDVLLDWVPTSNPFVFFFRDTSPALDDFGVPALTKTA